jgi:hypothetical protein
MRVAHLVLLDRLEAILVARGASAKGARPREGGCAPDCLPHPGTWDGRGRADASPSTAWSPATEGSADAAVPRRPRRGGRGRRARLARRGLWGRRGPGRARPHGPLPHRRRRRARRRRGGVRARRRRARPRVPGADVRMVAVRELSLTPRRAGAALRPAVLRPLGVPRGGPRPRHGRRRSGDERAAAARRAAHRDRRRLHGRRGGGGRGGTTASGRGRRSLGRAEHARSDGGHRRGCGRGRGEGHRARPVRGRPRRSLHLGRGHAADRAARALAHEGAGGPSGGGGHGWNMLVGTTTEWSPLAVHVAAFIRRAGRSR